MRHGCSVVVFCQPGGAQQHMERDRSRVIIPARPVEFVFALYGALPRGFRLFDFLQSVELFQPGAEPSEELIPPGDELLGLATNQRAAGPPLAVVIRCIKSVEVVLTRLPPLYPELMQIQYPLRRVSKLNEIWANYLVEVGARDIWPVKLGVPGFLALLRRFVFGWRLSRRHILL